MIYVTYVTQTNTYVASSIHDYFAASSISVLILFRNFDIHTLLF